MLDRSGCRGHLLADDGLHRVRARKLRDALVVEPLIDELAVDAAHQVVPGRQSRQLDLGIEPQRRVELHRVLELALEFARVDLDEPVRTVRLGQEREVLFADDRDEALPAGRRLEQRAVRDANHI